MTDASTGLLLTFPHCLTGQHAIIFLFLFVIFSVTRQVPIFPSTSIYIIFPCFHPFIFRISPYFIFSTTHLPLLQPLSLFHAFTLGSILILFPNHHIFPPPPHQDLYLLLKILIFLFLFVIFSVTRQVPIFPSTSTSYFHVFTPSFSAYRLTLFSLPHIFVLFNPFLYFMYSLWVQS